MRKCFLTRGLYKLRRSLNYGITLLKADNQNYSHLCIKKIKTKIQSVVEKHWQIFQDQSLLPRHVESPIGILSISGKTGLGNSVCIDY